MQQRRLSTLSVADHHDLTATALPLHHLHCPQSQRLTITMRHLISFLCSAESEEIQCLAPEWTGVNLCDRERKRVHFTVPRAPPMSACQSPSSHGDTTRRVSASGARSCCSLACLYCCIMTIKNNTGPIQHVHCCFNEKIRKYYVSVSLMPL